MAGTSSLAAIDAKTIGDAAATITTLATTHGITAAPEPIDTFADTASRLSNVKITFDRVERLLLALTRAGLVDRRGALRPPRRLPTDLMSWL